MTKKLNSMPYANAYVNFTEDGVELVSYTTVVLTLTYDGWLEIYGLYSMTTRKHISAFMREYTNLDYSTAKHCYEDNYILNVETGEIVERS